MTFSTGLLSMINAAKTTAGSVGSLIKDPSAAVRSSLAGHLGTLGNYAKVPELAALAGSLGALSSNVASSISSKLANLHHDLPVASAGAAISAKLNMLDGQGSGPPPDASAAFSSITQGPSILQGAHDQVAGLVSQLPSIATIPDPTIQVSDGNGGTTTQPNPAYTSWKNANSTLFTSISSVTSAASTAQSNFTSALSTEASAMAGHLDMIKGFSLANMMANPSAAIASVINSVVDTSQIPSSAADVLKMKNAIPRASFSSIKLTGSSFDAYENRVPPSDSTLATLKANYETAKANLETAGQALSAEVDGNDAFCKSIGIYAAKAAVDDDPTNQAKKDTYAALQQQLVQHLAGQHTGADYSAAADAKDAAEAAYMNALRRR